MSLRLSPARALLPALLVTACAAGGQLRADVRAVRAELVEARGAGAERCAADELSDAEASLEEAERRLGRGEDAAARARVEAAGRSARRARELARTCAAPQVTIRKGEPAARVIIEKTDGDRDGVPDLDDRCPDAPGPSTLQGCPDADGDGIGDAEDACPAEAGPAETLGCPPAKDSDGDGVPDEIDRCPLDPEDADGFQEEDGCPDPDDDGDGIVDRVDACPHDQGPLENRGCPVMDADGDGVADPDDRCPEQAGVAADGCPRAYRLLEVGRDRIALREPVRFGARDDLLPSSAVLLDELAQALRDRPRLRVAVEVHTDGAGEAAASKRLSQARAEAVRAALAGRGIEAERVEAKGFGAEHPIASNKTARGRAQNRRTEIRILPGG
ncbi:OmpA/MotB domain protein [Anaeromyxobacter dehalogenans 2CP-1]|uniref:OmpA/MotB domain protein n=1 Tax=Anaeromyxobacter dehalogenans (strain ATCC BAA-258 / DSM 21875 / 2CP-1) TaxID=455488 RepID=B8J7D0_ANAD2|nr:OmpA family protein [Anaeromyxobacter dehalogenans]ACL67110.1 OmpA/MotB domain protein [Anaeromyxobacter dehalogenans 2CP-1]